MQQYKRMQHWAAQALCVFLLSGMVHAQEQAADATEPVVARQTPTSVDDEIIVTGERSLNALVARAGRLTLNFYDMLNAAIDEKEFSINCGFEKHTGSMIQQRVCRPRYVQSAQAREASQQFFSIPIIGETRFITGDDAVYDPMPDIVMKQREFQERILKAVNDDPALNRAFWELYALKREIESIRETD